MRRKGEQRNRSERRKIGRDERVRGRKRTRGGGGEKV